ncbi:hypothetical protein C5167_035326 [Papaver somniferum]|uniref:Uncharacterized protein n=1 Tax=Papaver somniferum TaxID=3469 RepID=A0A4Y7KH10_PAPSO|nr:hypothetical protein C5167_035326 [Papaver somniferum]
MMVNEHFLFDTLALVRKLEKEGFESKHAEAVTDALTQVLSDSLENVAQLYVSNGQMKKIQMGIQADISKFKSQVNCFLFIQWKAISCSLVEYMG